MSGLECSEISFKFIVNKSYDFRIESEFYKKEDMRTLRKLESSSGTILDDNLVETVTDGTHYTPDYVESGIPFLSAVNVKENILDLSAGYKYITEKCHRTLCKRVKPQEFDILLRKVGVGKRMACIVPKTFSFSIFVSVALIRAKINPYYLCAFINTKYGQLQLLRFNKGISQPDLHLEDIRKMFVPLFSATLYQTIEGVFCDAENIRAQSLKKYQEAEKLLLSALALDTFTLSTQNTSVKNFSEVAASERLDAEYYHPKYDELMRLIHTHAEKIIAVKDICTKNHRGVQPDYIEGGEIAVVNSKNILENGLDYENFSATSRAAWDLTPKAHIEKGDILIYTTGANVGRAALYRADSPALASNHVNILRVTHKHPKYIAFVINSMIGRLQTERLSTGSAQQELYPSDIENFFIPLVPESKQAKIEALLDESYALREKSKALLKAATRAVEIAIEENEAAAMEYLREQERWTQ